MKLGNVILILMLLGLVGLVYMINTKPAPIANTVSETSNQAKQVLPLVTDLPIDPLVKGAACGKYVQHDASTLAVWRNGQFLQYPRTQVTITIADVKRPALALFQDGTVHIKISAKDAPCLKPQVATWSPLMEAPLIEQIK